MCQLLPSENITFTAERYKNFLSKLFSKVELFLCLEADFLREFNNQDTKSNPSNNEQIIDIGDEDVDDNVHLPFSSFCTEGITTTEHKEEGDLRNLDNIFLNDENNNNVSSSLPAAISSRNDRSTITTDYQRAGVDRKVPCPICGKSFPINNIASHADLCAGKHQNEILREIHCDKDSGNINEEDDSEVVIKVENKQSLEEHSKPETLINQVLENCSAPIGEDCPKICIEVFRGNCFSDFRRYFNKKWYKDKPVCQYEISFAGESGQDQGGVRREFYSGMSYFYFLYISLYCSFCLTLL